MPDRTITTKAGEVHRSGFSNMLERMTAPGTPAEQHMKLQILKGLYKTKRCNYDASSGGCKAGDKCCFLHASDNEYIISQRVTPLRREVFTKLYDMKFALPLELCTRLARFLTKNSIWAWIVSSLTRSVLKEGVQDLGLLGPR